MNLTYKTRENLEKILKKLPFIQQEAEAKLIDELGEDAKHFKKKYKKLYDVMVKINYDHFMVAVFRKMMGSYMEEERTLKGLIKKKKYVK